MPVERKVMRLSLYGFVLSVSIDRKEE